MPHSRLLPLCDAALHAGGAGTTNAALLAGVPQLLCPLHFDQFSWVRATPPTGASRSRLPVSLIGEFPGQAELEICRVGPSPTGTFCLAP